jgi:enamine deaminase RidA (YjgF/YER057c/UK114 family)
MAKLVQSVNPTSLAMPAGNSYGIEVHGGKTLYIAGQVSRDKDGGLVGKDDLVAQFRRICENLQAVLLARAGRLVAVVD